LYHSTQSILALYGTQLNNHENYRNFLEEYQKGLHFPDKENIIVKALANVIRRTIILINSTEIDPEKQMIKTN